MPEKINSEQFLELCEESGDGAQLELSEGVIFFGNTPFYEFVKKYLALRGEEPRPKPSPQM